MFLKKKIKGIFIYYIYNISISYNLMESGSGNITIAENNSRRIKDYADLCYYRDIVFDHLLSHGNIVNPDKLKPKDIVVANFKYL